MAAIAQPKSLDLARTWCAGLFTGAVMIALGLGGAAWISHGFIEFGPLDQQPIHAFTAAMIFAGIGYGLFSLVIGKRAIHISGKSFLALALLGLVLRLIMFASQPALEDDYYRYFFDGALVTKGLNPYTIPPSLAAPDEPTPADLHENTAQDTAGDSRLQFLDAYPDARKVAYPDVATIYPPVAQAFFALAALVSKFDLTVWRCLLLFVDLITVYLLLKLLAHLALPRAFVLLYWLNPLLIREIFNAGHMDVLLFPFLLLALYWGLGGKPVRASLALVGAVGVKLWPLMLAPYLVRKHLREPHIAVLKLLPFLVLSAALMVPQLMTLDNGGSGLRLFSEGWQRNSFLFGLFTSGFDALWDIGWLDDDNSQIYARALSYGILLVILMASFFKHSASGQGLERQWLLAIASLFFLAPTGFPWYYLWFLPLLALRPSAPLLLMTVLLPLYDLRFYYYGVGEDLLVHSVIIPLQFLPPLLWMLGERFWPRLHLSMKGSSS